MDEERLYITHIIDQDNPEVKHYFKDLSAEEAISTLESSSHKHENEIALNQITSDKITEWNNKLNSNEVSSIVSGEIAKVVAEAPESFDTLKEIADWIENDTTGAAKMANDIKSLKTTAEDITDSKQIVFDTGFQITETVGGITPKVLDKPMSLKDLLKSILCKEVAGRITAQPSVSVSLNPSTTSYETGTTVQPTVNFSFSGSYSANNGLTGTPIIDVKDTVINGTPYNSNSLSYRGSKTKLLDDANITYKVEISYKIVNANSIYIKSNLGNSGQSLKDALSLDSTLITKKEATTPAITSYRNVFYGKSTETNLNHWDIRTLENRKKFERNSKNNSIEMTAEIGDTYIVAAIPSGASNIKTEYWLESASAWKEWKEFDREVTNVGGADATENDIGFVDITYYIYYFRTMNHSPFTSKTKFRISYDHKEV